MRALIVCACLAAATPAAAQIIPGWETKQFTLERLDAERVRFSREVEINGVGANAGNQIFADELEYNTRTGEFTASGNVLLVSPTARLSAERVTFNTRTDTGMFHTASGLASLRPKDGLTPPAMKSMFGTLEPDVYFYGETIEKIGADRYRITKGGFTTCVQPTPRWEVVTNQATIDLGDYAILRNAVIRVKDVPIFYLPVMYYPIQEDDRATGFLMPTYGRSLYRGQSISNAFFWAINRSQDLTAFHDWFGRGQGFGSEYRYVAGPRSEGGVRAYRLNEKESTFDLLGGGTTVQPARQSYEIAGGLTQELPAGLRARARVDYFSNLTTQQLFNNNIYDTTRRSRTLGGSVTGDWAGVTVTGNFQRNELFGSDTDSIVNGYWPSLSADLASRRIARLPLYVAATSAWSNVVYLDRRVNSETDLGMRRIDVMPTLRAALSKLTFLSINGAISFRQTYFSESVVDGVQVPEPITRRYFDLRADVIGPLFSRVYTPGNAIAERLKHVIEPNVSVQRITRFDNQDSVSLTANPYEFVVGGVTRLNYGLTNRVLVRKAPKDSAAPAAANAARELLSVAVTQSYYTNARASQFDLTYQSSYGVRAPSNFSPIALTVRATPTPLTTSTFRLEYDHEVGVVQGVNFSGSSTYRAAQVSAGWSTQRVTETRQDNALNVSTTLNLLEGRTGGTYQLNWDIGRGYVIQQRYIGFYNAQCCGFAVEYQEFNYPAFDPRFPVPKDRRFNLSFTLAGIGTFSNFFGTFGGRQ